MDEVIIRAQELNKTFSLKRGKRVEALKDLDLTVKKGELTAIIGPDGAGKTRSEERRVGKECRSRWSPYH